ncbi:MAG: hypothetical protein U1E40_15565 [Amaricoccus sp.]
MSPREHAVPSDAVRVGLERTVASDPDNAADLAGRHVAPELIGFILAALGKAGLVVTG